MNKALNGEWIRRDRETGYLMVVSEDVVRRKIQGIYTDTELAMNNSSKDNPITTGFADYWPNDGTVETYAP